MDDVKEFAKLFVSNSRSFGQWNPKSGKMHTKKEVYCDEEIKKHLSGKMGLGLVPIKDNNKCLWGAIDIDNHSGVDVNIAKITKTAYELGLPLVICESKSGGAHCYLFGSEPLPAHFIRQILTKWATDLGFQGSEIFPKQSRLVKDKNAKDKQLGNWINLPYFNKDSRLARKYVMNVCQLMDYEEFIETANKMKVDQQTLESFVLLDHKGAPPCIQKMIMNGIESGYRNEGLYSLTVYLRKAFPEDFEARAFDINQTIFEKPLSFAEAKKTIKSANNKSYKYKCMEEPCRSNCDSETCLKQEFGISQDDLPGLSRADMPTITDVKIYDMEPPIWEMKLNGIIVSITTSQLYNYMEFAKIIMEKLLIIAPPMKNKDWLNALAGLMANVERIETPEDAGASGMIKTQLIDYLSKADLTNNGKDTTDRDMVARGVPVVQELGISGIDGRHVIFKGTDFIAFLKRTKTDVMNGPMLWNTMQHFGVTHRRLRVQGKVIPIWAVPVDDHHRTKLDFDYLREIELPEKKEKGFEFKSEF